MIDQLIAKHDELSALPTERRLLFFNRGSAERRRRLLTENIRGLRTAFREVKAAHPFTMEAVVILPDHLHCIWTLPEGDDDFSTRWRQIKAAFSRQLPNTERRSKSRFDKGERGIWQRIGSMRYGTRWITSVMWITSITTRQAWMCYGGGGLAISSFHRFSEVRGVSE